jgi:hypothetical protein
VGYDENQLLFFFLSETLRVRRISLNERVVRDRSVFLIAAAFNLPVEHAAAALCLSLRAAKDMVQSLDSKTSFQTLSEYRVPLAAKANWQMKDASLNQLHHTVVHHRKATPAIYIYLHTTQMKPLLSV